MTQQAAIAYSLLKGETISIMTGFKEFGCTNIPREIGRGIERKFGVMVERQPVKFVSRYGHTGEYYKYKLNKRLNEDGLKKMAKYIADQIGEAKTTQEKNIIQYLKPLLN